MCPIVVRSFTPWNSFIVNKHLHVWLTQFYSFLQDSSDCVLFITFWTFVNMKKDKSRQLKFLVYRFAKALFQAKSTYIFKS